MNGLAELVAGLRDRRLVVLTGAGISTDSGIPDYRGPARAPRKPVQYQDFVRSAEARQRYWARSAIGWPRFRAARPNAGHAALARLEAAGRLTGLLTQNVDRLHTAAGQRDVIELHGALAEVVCLGCGGRRHRDELQEELQGLNPGWSGEAEDAPDGDVDLESWRVAGFRVPDCPACGGMLKPDVVFFGENVPAARVDAAWARLAEAEALLVIGSSLTVFSGFRFPRRAATEGKPVYIVNQGETRADALATLKLDAPIGPTLTALADALT